ncbi:MAG: NAD(P)(+) transhydrogenase (Re/Si-specific) subunit beta, partial [Candidatus Nanoarchaeia archaeon]|nr:NAD(P)(+) transhydrogenase (Re/Si-specific) subunit beta [Candidatus Nanoarchaeia archaeon]
GTAGTAAFGAFEKVTAVLGLIVGGVTFAGSLIAAGKLAGKINQRPIVFERQLAINNLALIVTVALGLLAIVSGGAAMVVYAVLVLIGSLAYGVLFTVKVGGADMPITVSLLNSFSGVAASISGFAIGNSLLIAIGAVVGASGLILTQIMCRAMNRTLGQVLSGRTTVLRMTSGQKAAAGSAGPSRPAQLEGASTQASPAAVGSAPAGEPEHIRLARFAKSVIVVPGYGMALAQAQGDVKALMDRLEAGGAQVKVAIHPVAGRMPGHMNVLLAEVDVPYDKLYEMDQVNDEFAETDLAIVVGANDVINPAANTAEGTPIYGMPILNVHEARHVIIFNYDTKPGYAGVDNPLYEPSAKVTLLLGDAAKTVREFMSEVGL